jgi:hypothetical protein
MLAAPAALAAVAQTAMALDANDVRGGWETTVDGIEHVYEFSIRGDKVAGIACGACDDATTLAFIDGRLDPNGITFTVRHVRDDGSTAYQDHATALIEGDHLAVSGRSGAPGGGPFQWAMHKDPRGPAPAGTLPGAALPQVGAPAANAAAYGPNGQAPVPFGPPPGAGPARVWQQPGPWEQLAPAKLVGVWFIGTGPNKQYFIIRKVGGQLLGMVCGPCSNPYSMAALDGFRLDGDTLHFNIDHEDWGFGKLPFHNMVTAKVTRDEMRFLSVVQDNLPPQPGPGFVVSLTGPVSVEATAIR